MFIRRFDSLRTSNKRFGGRLRILHSIGLRDVFHIAGQVHRRIPYRSRIVCNGSLGNRVIEQDRELEDATRKWLVSTADRFFQFDEFL